jgi:DNA-binding CsgD family transcriptional regulator
VTAPARPALTELEATVLRMVADGWTYAEIASRLTYTTSGITSVASRMFPKLGARSAPHAVHMAYQLGLLRRERHGDHPGYEAHIRRGDEICQPCRDGEKAYRAALKARQAPQLPA